MTFFQRQSAFETALAILIAIVIATLAYEAFFATNVQTIAKPKENEPCKGVALRVDYPYHGGMLSPHACKPQCEDGVQRYILYANNKATQCQILPGCLDWGEDQGVTCQP